VSNTIDHSASHQGEAKNHALISYILLAIGLFTAIPILIGAVWAMVKRRDARGTVYHSHYTNVIRVFWWTVFWTIIGFILLVAVIGYAILGILWLWALYRLVNGMTKILSDQPYPV
jgi:uncharacterized membrane protein